MGGRILVRTILGLVLLNFALSPLPAADPTVLVTGVGTLREQARLKLTARGSDPDNDPLTYSWTILSDPTGRAFLGSTFDTQVSEATLAGIRVGLSAGPNFPEPSFEGQEIVLLLKVSDGTTTIQEEVVVPVGGVNRPPVLSFDTSQMGTSSQPRLTGQGFGINALGSYDPDGSFVKFLWQIDRLLGSGPCSAGLVLFGKETATPGFPVPQMGSTPLGPTHIILSYVVEDGLNILTGTLTGYLATVGGCSTNTPLRSLLQPALRQRVSARKSA